MRTTSKNMVAGLLLAGGLALGAGCDDDGAPGTGMGGSGGGGAGGGGAGGAGGAASAKAEAKLDPTSATSMTKGDAKFDQAGGQVTLEVKLEGAPAGTHAVHLHMNGDCSTTMDAAGTQTPAGGAGGHWNPEMMTHGKFGTAPHHLGDVGNLTVGADGKGMLTFSTNRWTIGSNGTNDIVGKSVVIHAAMDDFMTDPTGNAGGRISCGVISKK